MNYDVAIKICVIFLVLDVVFLIITPLAYIQVKNWWSDKYDEEKFNCVDMSYVLEEKFESLGIDAKVVYGYNVSVGGKNASAHCWLLVNGWEFEAVTLDFRKVSDGYDEYFIEEGKYLHGKRIYGHIEVNVTLSNYP